jgi:membrane protease YdiL (CAAX protease family)
MNINRFLAGAWRGEQEPVLQIVAIVVTWIIFLVLGGSLLLIPVAALQITDPSKAADYLADPTNFKLLGIDMTLVFVLIMMQFVIGFGGLWIMERFVLKKQLRWVITGFKRFRWRRMMAGMAAWMGLMCVYQTVGYFIDPTSVKMTVEWGRFLIFLPFALILVPIQSAFEEVAIRGQLMHGLIRLAPNQPYLPLLLSSGIFAGLHIMNSEVATYGAGLMMAHYFTFGLVLGAFALIDEGLELSIGIHAGNNIFSLCLVSYPGSSLSTPTLLEQQGMAAAADFIVMLVFVAIMYFIFFGRRKNAPLALVQNISTGPAEAGDEFEKV